VAIPDTNFGNWLYAHGDSSCLIGNSVSGYQLDTTCTNILQTSTVDCSGDSIADLTGIQYFKNLGSLFCERNVLTSLPPLPGSLYSLNCDFNQLTSITALPGALVYFYCSNNFLAGLPALPASLRQLNCSNNVLISLPVLPMSMQGMICSDNNLISLPALSDSLVSIDCSYNQLTQMPSLPSVLRNLQCFQNQISTMPALDDSLYFLNCSGNHLTALPALPPLLTTFDCSFNQLAALPALPSVLISLYCENNAITSVPALPDTTSTIYCGYNQLTSIDSLPFYMVSFNCAGNANLSCLPIIYQSHLNDFYIDSTNIQCLPDHFSATFFDMDPDSMPQCTAVSGCAYTASTGIAELTANALTIYPNPNKGAFTLSVAGQATSNGALSYTITDMLGNVVAQQTITTNSQQVDLSDAAEGVYTLVVKGSAPLRFTVMR
jgi:Leucine-rich repeat (LRR) protein